MSHLFQRLASNVTRPSGEPSLRPLAGSIYMPANQRASSEPSPIETIDSPAASRFSPTESGLPREDLSAAKAAAHPLADRSIHARTPDVPIATQFSTKQESLLPDHPQESLPDWAPPRAFQRNITAVGAELGAAESRNNDRLSLAAGPPEDRAVPGSQSSVVRHQPLLPPTPLELPGSSLHSLRGPEKPLSLAQRRSADSGRPASAPSREPDEIFIHIGRVEVAAVQQSPQQPAVRPAPQRKSINLSDYLRRGSGRPR